VLVVAFAAPAMADDRDFDGFHDGIIIDCDDKLLLRCFWRLL